MRVWKARIPGADFNDYFREMDSKHWAFSTDDPRAPNKSKFTVYTRFNFERNDGIYLRPQSLDGNGAYIVLTPTKYYTVGNGAYDFEFKGSFV